MAVRASMDTLIRTVRTLIADPASATAVFDDPTIQDQCDRHRTPAAHWPLAGQATYGAAGARTVLDYYAQSPPHAPALWPRLGIARPGGGPLVVVEPGQVIAALGDWEDSCVLQDGAGTILTPTESDLIGGHWTLGTDPAGPVYLTGATYDLYAVAVDLLEMWAGRMKLAYDYSQNGQSFHRSQQLPAILELAKAYRRKRRPRTIPIGRSDLNPWPRY